MEKITQRGLGYLLNKMCSMTELLSLSVTIDNGSSHLLNVYCLLGSSYSRHNYLKMG